MTSLCFWLFTWFISWKQSQKESFTFFGSFWPWFWSQILLRCFCNRNRFAWVTPIFVLSRLCEKSFSSNLLFISKKRQFVLQKFPRKFFFFHFLAIFEHTFYPKSTSIFVFYCNYQRLLEFFILHEIVFSWIYHERNWKSLEFFCSNLKRWSHRPKLVITKCCYNTTPITKVKTSLKVMKN